MTPAVFQIYQGQSLVLTHALRLNKRTTDMSGWTVTNQLRRGSQQGEIMPSLNFEWIDPVAGTFRLIADEITTALWPTGSMYVVVKLTRTDGAVVYSKTLEIRVIKAPF